MVGTAARETQPSEVRNPRTPMRFGCECVGDENPVGATMFRQWLAAYLSDDPLLSAVFGKPEVCESHCGPILEIAAKPVSESTPKMSESC